MAYNSSNRSERLLQNRRFTTDALSLTQEAFTSVLDIGIQELYYDTEFIPVSSSLLAFSGSAQNGLIVSASVVNPSISFNRQILRYWWRKKLKPAADGTQQVYYFTTSDPATPTSTVTSDQIVESDQQTNFTSPKYIRPADSVNTAEANPPGYRVIVYKSTSATGAGITEAAADPATYVFDYKTGVLSWLTGFAPTATQYVYISAYQYVGRTLNQVVSNVTGSLFGSSSWAQYALTASYVNNLNQNVAITGSVDITGSLVVNGVNVASFGIFKQTGSFWATTNDLQITGSTKINGDLLVSGLVSGNFYGSGDNLWFTRLGTSQSAASNLVIGNYFNNYAFKQTTTFRNAEVIVSGNLTIADTGVLILEPKSVAPTPVTGGIYYRLNDGFYVTEI